jgi:hypothetical protein
MKPVVLKPFGSKPVRKKIIDREGQEQAALLSEIELRYPQVFELIYHVPNGGHRHKMVAMKLKQQGVKAGIPDLVLPMARGGFFGLYIEFKATVDPAAISPSQAACIRRLNDQGYLAVVCRGHFDAMEQIRAYLRLAPTVVAA